MNYKNLLNVTAYIGVLLIVSQTAISHVSAKKNNDPSVEKPSVSCSSSQVQHATNPSSAESSFLNSISPRNIMTNIFSSILNFTGLSHKEETSFDGISISDDDAVFSIDTYLKRDINSKAKPDEHDDLTFDIWDLD